MDGNEDKTSDSFELLEHLKAAYSDSLNESQGSGFDNEAKVAQLQRQAEEIRNLLAKLQPKLQSQSSSSLLPNQVTTSTPKFQNTSIGGAAGRRSMEIVPAPRELVPAPREIVPAPTSEIYQNLGPQIMGAGLRPPLLPPKNAGKNSFFFKFLKFFFKFLIDILFLHQIQAETHAKKMSAMQK